MDSRLLARMVAIVLFATAMGGLLFQSGTFALPKIFAERLPQLAQSATLVGWYSFIVFTLAALAQVVVGFLVDRGNIRTIFVAVAAMQALFFFAMQGLSGVPAVLVALGFMLMVFGQIPIVDVLVGRVAVSHWRSRFYAIRYIVTFSVLAASLPLIGWIHAVWGFDMLFRLLGVAALCTLAGVTLLPRTAAAITGKAAETPAE